MTRTGSTSREPATIGFLHTAQVHVERFDTLLTRRAPGAAARHLVRPDLLLAARAAASLGVSAGGGNDLAAALEEAVAELSASCGAVLVTCSTLGPFVDALSLSHPVVRIDRPMAAQAVRLAGTRAATRAAEAALESCAEDGAEVGTESRPSPARSSRTTPLIAAVAALDSAVEPIRVLLAECAAREGTDVAVEVMPASGAWALFESGDPTGYRGSVERAVEHAAHTLLPDVIVLAQASMADLADPEGTRHGVPVLASPEPAVAETLRLVQS